VTEYVADIASWQSGLDLRAVQAVCAAVEIKCTQGITYTDPDYPGWLAAAKSIALSAVAYHYIDATDPAAQASYLKAHIGDVGLPVMLDLEKGGGTLDHALATADAMRAIGLYPRLLYLPRWYWAAAGSPDLAAPLVARGLGLINADYPTTAGGTPSGLYPGDDSPLWAGYGGLVPTMLQYTDNALIGGMGVDVNAYRGTAAELAALLGIPAAAPPPSDTPPTLRQGDHGDAVFLAQRYLYATGIAPGPLDAVFGPLTAAATRQLQIRSGLLVDMIIGPHTWQALRAAPDVIKRGYAGALVARVQRALAAAGHSPGPGPIDGVFGPKTDAAVHYYQAAHALAVDGIVGPQTLGVLRP
jgi:peptidoglycan hydrolase-like protein with peptidoglycan-binding domain